MSVKLREKQLKNGQISFYLDIYHNKKRWYEFLEIHIQKNKPCPDDKDKKRLAQEIRSKREHELIVEDNGLINKAKKHGCFVAFFEQFVREKSKAQGNSVLSNLKRFAGGKPVPFSSLNEQ